MSDKLNIAVIGAGYWGPNLIRNVAQTAAARLHTVCDADPDRLRAIAEQYTPLHQTTDHAQVFSNDEIDGVIIATPAHTHYDLAKQALQAGKHVLVEKPLALHAQEGRELVEMAAQRGLILMVGHVFLYNTAVQKLRDLIQSDELGKLYYIYSIRVNLGQIRDDLNAFWNLAPHDISIINMLLGGRTGARHGAGLHLSAIGYRAGGRDLRHSGISERGGGAHPRKLAGSE